MIKALQDKRWSMRVGAADGLGMFAADAEAAIPALIQALRDDAGQVREVAADSLAAIHRAVSAAPSAELLKLLDHQDASVRVTAARATAHINPTHQRALAALKAPRQDVVKAGPVPFIRKGHRQRADAHPHAHRRLWACHPTEARCCDATTSPGVEGRVAPSGVCEAADLRRTGSAIGHGLQDTPRLAVCTSRRPVDGGGATR
jgi:hypothetical protein